MEGNATSILPSESNKAQEKIPERICVPEFENIILSEVNPERI